MGAYDAATLEVSPLVLAMGLLSGLTVQSVLYFRQTCGWTPRIRRYTELRFGFRAILLLIAALPTFYTLVGLSLSPYTLLFALAVVHTALTFGLYTARLKRLDAGQAAIVATVEPVVVGAIGVVLLGEELTALKVIGALLVLAGAALAQVRLEKASHWNTVPEEHSRLR